MNLIYNNKTIPIPTDQPLILGRNPLLEITDERISRRQVSVSYNQNIHGFQVCALSPNVTLNGSLLKMQDTKSIYDQDKLCLYKDSCCVTFVMAGTVDSCSVSEISQESSDIYDFEK
jgi:hypothetical protein